MPSAISATRSRSAPPLRRTGCWPGRTLPKKLPLLAAALPFVGHFQTRNKGTVCGSVAHADPSSEIPLSLAMLEGEVVLRSRRGTRMLAAKRFQKDMLTTAREPDELIIAVRFPVMSGRGVAFREVARRHGDFAMVAVAAMVENAEHDPARRRRHGRPAGGAAHRGRRRFRGRRGRRVRLHRSLRATRTFTLLPRCGATCCAISARSSSRRRSDAPHKQGSARPDQADTQRPQAVGRSRAAHAAQRLPASLARRDRDPCRLRAWRLRLLHGADRRQRRALVPDARGAGRGPRRHDGGDRSPAPTASSIPCSRRSRTTMPCSADSARPAS